MSSEGMMLSTAGNFRLFVNIRHSPCPPNLIVRVLTGGEPVTSEGQITLAVMRFFLISRCTRRAHDAS